MNRREFVGLSALGTASLWMPGCAPRSPDAIAADDYVLGTNASAFSSDGRSFAIMADQHVVELHAADGALIGTIGEGRGAAVSRIGDLDGPLTAIWDEAGARLLVLEQGNERVQAFDARGRALGVFAQTERPADMFLDEASKSLYVAESSMHRVQVLSMSGQVVRTVGAFGMGASGLNGPASVAVAPDGNLHVVNAGSASIKVFAPSGSFVGEYGQSRLVGPRSVRFDGTGRVWVADRFAGTVCLFDPSGKFLDKISPRLSGGAAAPTALSVRPDGSIYVAVAPSFASA